MNEGPDSPVSSSGSWLSRYEAWAEWPLVVLAAGFLVAYALPILDRQLPHDVAHLLRIFNVAVWAVFAADYLARLAGTSDRIRFIRATWLDLAAVVLPMLRPLRALRLIRVIRVLDRKAAMGLRGRTAIYVCATTALVMFSASLAILDAERDNPDATIRDFADALWWAVTTITTVGYGDRYPVTAQGKIIASTLMLGGIALLGIVTATVASWFIQRVSEAQQAETVTQSQLNELLAEIRDIKARLPQDDDRNPRTMAPGQQQPPGERQTLSRL